MANVKIQQKRRQRQQRVRTRTRGTTTRPRLTVFRSHKAIYGQLIDDTHGRTIAAASSRELKLVKDKKAKDTQASADGREKKEAFRTGELIAERAIAAKIDAVVFDRGRYAYHGRIKAFADGARAGGLKF